MATLTLDLKILDAGQVEHFHLDELREHIKEELERLAIAYRRLSLV